MLRLNERPIIVIHPLTVSSKADSEFDGQDSSEDVPVVSGEQSVGGGVEPFNDNDTSPMNSSLSRGLQGGRFTIATEMALYVSTEYTELLTEAGMERPLRDAEQVR